MENESVLDSILKIESDRVLEKLWESSEDIPFDENENGELILSVDWGPFKAGTEREEIWHWFDERHSKGVAYLLYEYEFKGE